MPVTPTPQQNHYSAYVGRFAPSPSGPLHFGSLVAALGSYLQARHAKGKWLVRIEDIDPPREVQGASQAILDTLEQHQLFWDQAPLYQSQRSEHYDNAIARLIEKGLTYYCHCSRASLTALGDQTLCACVNAKPNPVGAAIRFKNSNAPHQFYDLVQGQVDAQHSSTEAQFAIKRKDGLYAYQLAVVVDDIAQGVTQVVRGADLLHATFYQLALYQAFAATPPEYAHLPVVESQPGKKLSKQNHAQALDNKNARHNVVHALAFLGMTLPQSLHNGPLPLVLEWATEHWRLSAVPRKLARNDNRIQTA